MLHSAKADVAREARNARRALERMARPAGEFDASRYFRGAVDLGFYNVGTAAMRRLARSIQAAHRDDWSIDDAMEFAGVLVADRYLEVKSVGIELVARYRRQFTPKLLPAWKRWLTANYAANWATTDAICGYLIGPLLVQYPALAARMTAWSRDANLWVRRASIVSLIPSVRNGLALDLTYDIAARLHADREDLIQKAVGWVLREAGKADATRLERYLRAAGPAIPRTTLRYAIERFAPDKRLDILNTTRSVPEKSHGSGEPPAPATRAGNSKSARRPGARSRRAGACSETGGPDGR
jgi:3-methyladenine DNA glycosylase AlkD